jgi:hypothetical protein
MILSGSKMNKNPVGIDGRIRGSAVFAVIGGIRAGQWPWSGRTAARRMAPAGSSLVAGFCETQVCVACQRVPRRPGRGATYRRWVACTLSLPARSCPRELSHKDQGAPVGAQPVAARPVKTKNVSWRADHRPAEQEFADRGEEPSSPSLWAAGPARRSAVAAASGQPSWAAASAVGL